MAMLALAIGGDAISSQARRETIIDGLFDLPSKFQHLEPLSLLSCAPAPPSIPGRNARALAFTLIPRN